MEPIRIIVVDDHVLVRSALCALLGHADDVRTVAQAGSAEEALELLRVTEADLALVDLQMPGMGGIAGVGAIRRAHPQVAVVVLSMREGSDDVRRAFAAGASGYVTKDAAGTDLLQAVRAVAAGERWVHPAVGAALAHEQASEPATDALSAGERDVLELLARGYTHREIAEALAVPVGTVEGRRARIMSKLHVTSRAGMVHRARVAGLLALSG